MIAEHDIVVLTEDVADVGLEAGDIGTVVHVHKGGAGYEVEIMTLAGETVAVVTLRAVPAGHCCAHPHDRVGRMDHGIRGPEIGYS